MEIETTAPGKVILHGEHAVVYGSKAIAVAVGLNTKVKITSSSNAVHLKFQEVGIDTKFTAKELDDLRLLLKIEADFSFEKLNSIDPIPIDPSVVKHVEKFVNERALIHCTQELKDASKSAFEAFMFMYLAMFETSKNIEIQITTKLPVGAGLGSSASFGVALTGALLISSGRMKKDSINYDMVNKWAYASECFVHGNPSGIDNSVATHGGAVLYQKGHPLVHLKCSGIRALLVNTEVPRSTKALVAKLATYKEHNPTRHAEIMHEINSLVESVIIELDKTGQTKPEFVSRNQELLCELSVSHPKIDLIVNIAKQHNLNAKLTGAGGGGCVFVFIPPGFTEDQVKSLQSDLASKNLTKSWYITLGGKGFSI